MTQRARILPRKYWSPACNRYVSRETGEPIWPLRLIHKAPDFIMTVGGVVLLCTALVIAAKVI